jgi:peroxiredoxin Q/BCP
MPESGLHVGDVAPDFELPDDQGKRVRLSDLRGKRVVLYFYPMDDTPGCTTQACGFRDALPQIELANAVVLGISPDDVQSHQAFKAKYQLPFTLLVDKDHTVAETYGVWNSEHGYATRSQFIIDEAGRLADVQVPVRAGESAPMALQALGSLR